MPAPKGNKHAVGNDGGRPTKYRKEYAEQLIEFFSCPEERFVELPHYDKEGKVAWVDKKVLPEKLPTIVQFCKKLNIVPSTFYCWVKEHVEFSNSFM